MALRSYVWVTKSPTFYQKYCAHAKSLYQYRVSTPSVPCNKVQEARLKSKRDQVRFTYACKVPLCMCNE